MSYIDKQNQEWKLQLKPSTGVNAPSHTVIQLTDMALHTTEKRSTLSIWKKIKESIRTKRSGRFFGAVMKNNLSTDINLTMEDISNDPEFIKSVLEENRKGRKVYVSVPKNGIPVVLGRDTIEFMNSKNGKRILRKIMKEK